MILLCTIYNIGFDLVYISNVSIIFDLICYRYIGNRISIHKISNLISLYHPLHILVVYHKSFNLIAKIAKTVYLIGIRRNLHM